MKYRNKINGNVIDVNSEISGKNWEKLEESTGEVKSASPAAASSKRGQKVK